jgi:hypothetical protein
MARWRSTEHLEDHLLAHGTEVRARTVTEYDASAQETLEVGTYFEFWSDTVNGRESAATMRRHGDSSSSILPTGSSRTS